ncbi:MAG: glycosyltransferase [Lutisporaceae bacterium]|jgi:glycosyltransferase involved in cell wall biosynthesis
MDACINEPELKLSIITASCNSEKYIEDAIKSVLMQTYRNIEHIIIDGGSTDRTLDIINKYSRNLGFVSSEPDSGIYEAFNKGIKASSGDIIYFLNSDDYLYDEASVESIIKVFRDDNKLDIVYGNIVITDEKCRHSHTFGRNMSLDDFKKGYMPPHPGTFVRRRLFETYGLFDEGYKICGDFEFMLKCFMDDSDKIKYINRTIAVFREGGKSSDYRYSKIREAEMKQIISKYFGESTKESFTESSDNPNALCRLWLETLLLEEKGITRLLKSSNVKDVAIFGTRKMALYLYKDLQRENFRIVRFLDNNINMQNKKIYGISVESPEWLAKNHVDAVIVSIESSHDEEVIKQLREITGDELFIVSWKDLVKGA